MSNENTNIEKIKEIYILSKTANKKILHIIKIKKIKDNNDKKLFEINIEINNQKYNKITKIIYNIISVFKITNIYL